MKISTALTGAILLLTATSAALFAEDTRPDPGSDPWLVLRNEPDFSSANRITSAYLDSLGRSRPLDSRAQRATISDRSSLLAYQRAVRQAILASFGQPPERTPLNAQVTGTVVREGYRVENVIFESRPRYYVTANVYVPESGQARFPALLCPVGHWGAGKACEDYQRFAAYFARRGFVVLCYDGPGQGERVQTFDSVTRRPSVHPGTTEYFVTTEHGYLGSYAFLAQSSFARYLLWDGLRALDYLEQRGDVDKTRIACTGASGGGTQARQLAALDERIRVAIPVAYGGCAADTIYSPGVDDADIDALIAPRPLLLVCATGDGAAGNDRKRRGYAQLAPIYETLGARSAIDFFIAESRHGYTSPMYPTVYRWLTKWLRMPEPAPESLAERPIVLDSETTLACTLSGQVKTSLGGETVASLSRADASQRRAPAATPADAEGWRSWQRQMLERVGGKLGFPSGTTPLQPRTLRRSEQVSLVDERVVFFSDPGVYVPAVLLLPAAKQRVPAIIFVNQEAKAADAAPERYWLPLVRAGYAVLAIDPRGTGETGEGPVPREYRGFLSGPDATLFYGAIRAGTSIAGMQVRDVLAARAFLESRAEIDPNRLGILGVGSGGTLAAFAASLDARIKVAVSSGGLLSFDAIAASGTSTHRLTELVPGALGSFDLPDVATLVAPRSLVLANLVDATHGRVDRALAQSTYAQAKHVYRALSADNNLRIVDADSSEAIIQHVVAAFNSLARRKVPDLDGSRTVRGVIVGLNDVGPSAVPDGDDLSIAGERPVGLRPDGHRDRDRGNLPARVRVDYVKPASETLRRDARLRRPAVHQEGEAAAVGREAGVNYSRNVEPADLVLAGKRAQDERSIAPDPATVRGQIPARIRGDDDLATQIQEPRRHRGDVVARAGSIGDARLPSGAPDRKEKLPALAEQRAFRACTLKADRPPATVGHRPEGPQPWSRCRPETRSLPSGESVSGPKPGGRSLSSARGGGGSCPVAVSPETLATGVLQFRSPVTRVLPSRESARGRPPSTTATSFQPGMSQIFTRGRPGFMLKEMSILCRPSMIIVDVFTCAGSRSALSTNASTRPSPESSKLPSSRCSPT